MNEGYILLTPSLYDLYQEQVTLEFIERLIPVTDRIFCFMDFGAVTLIKDIPNLIISFRQFAPKQLNRYFSISLENILADISNKERIPVELLKRKTRKREIVEARQLYFRRAREISGKSFSDIGSLLGLDHATVMAGIKHVNDTKDLTEKYNKYFNQLV